MATSARRPQGFFNDIQPGYYVRTGAGRDGECIRVGKRKCLIRWWDGKPSSWRVIRRLTVIGWPR